MSEAVTATNAAIERAVGEGAERFSAAEETVARERIKAAKELADVVETINRVYDDLPFWIRRIRRALKRGESLVTNEWSFRGDTSPEYLKQLGLALGRISPKFQVTRTYYQDPLGIIPVRVAVFWKL